MHPENIPASPLPTVHDTVACTCWTIRVVAAPDPLLLPRVLQKLAVPRLEVRAVQYEAGSASTPAQIALEVTATRAWVHLLAGKIRKLVTVHQVEFETWRRP